MATRFLAIDANTLIGPELKGISVARQSKYAFDR